MPDKSNSEAKSGIRAVVFDYMGTCLDWHGSITAALPASVPAARRSPFALEWRKQYFRERAARSAAGLGVENIDLTFRRALDVLLAPGAADADLAAHFPDDAARERVVGAWHVQRAWPEVAAALQALRERGWEVYVHANGSTRLQLDITRASGLRFDMLLSSELLDAYMPAPESYERALKLLDLKAEQVVKVAAHAYDLRGAKQVGMKTVYIRRWTDDLEEDQSKLGAEFDAILDDMTTLADAIAHL